MTTSYTIFAKAVSFFLFPLFMPLYSILLLFNMNMFSFYSTAYIVHCCSIVIGTCILVPMLLFFIAEKTKAISDIKMRERGDRPVPLLLTGVCHLACATLLYSLRMPTFTVNIAVAIGFTTIITAFVSHWWKISVHMTGIGGLLSGCFIVGLATGVNLSPTICIALLFAGMLASARLILERHTPLQLVAGFLNGAFFVLTLSSINWSPMLRSIPSFLL